MNQNAFDEDAPVREFVFQNSESVFLFKGTKVRIGFFLSDGISLTMFGDAKAAKHNQDIQDVQWMNFERKRELTDIGYPINEETWFPYKWCPLFRLLC